MGKEIRQESFHSSAKEILLQRNSAATQPSTLALCNIFKPLIPVAWWKKVFLPALFCFYVLKGWLGRWHCRRAWGRKWNTVVNVLCGRGSGLRIPLSWTSAAPATPQQLPDFVTGMTKLPRSRQCGKWLWRVQFFILSWPLHLVASQETLRFLVWPQWLLFVNAAPYFATQTLRWVFSACFHGQHNVPGGLLRNCSSEPNSATA